MKPIIQKVLAIAAKEVGVREIGNTNTGRRVREYQDADTLGGTGYPWCASFVSWVLKQAKVENWLYTASCDFILDWARRNNLISKSPQAGDVFLLLSASNPNDAIHTGFVESVEANKFTTLEGNTNTDGSANGNGVYRLKRTNSARYVFVRWGNLIPNSPEEKIQCWPVVIGQKTVSATVTEGLAWIKAADWAVALGFTLGWNNDTQAVTLNGKEVSAQPKIIEGRAWLKVRDLANAAGLKLDVEPGKITVTK